MKKGPLLFITIIAVLLIGVSLYISNREISDAGFADLECLKRHLYVGFAVYGDSIAASATNGIHHISHFMIEPRRTLE